LEQRDGLGNLIACYRVSTAQQGRSGLGLEAQQEAVRAYLDGGCWKLIGEHTKIESGKLRDRPQLKAPLEQCRLTGAILVIAKLDRLSRNVAFLAQLMDSNDVQFVAVDNPHATRFTLHILAAVAEHEAAQISKRTKDVLDAARSAASDLAAGGRQRGRGAADGARRVPGGCHGYCEGEGRGACSAGVTVARELKGRGMSLRQIAAELTPACCDAPRGGAWSVSSVRNLLQRDMPTT
jgi:Resolvase, N terminal domain